MNHPSSRELTHLGVLKAQIRDPGGYAGRHRAAPHWAVKNVRVDGHWFKVNRLGAGA